MRNFIVVFLLLLGANQIGVAQNSLLWKVTGKGLKQPSYLFGTIHMICEDDFFIPEPVNKAFAQSQKLILEIDVSDPAMVQKAAGASINKNFRNFKVDLNDSDRQFLDSCLKADMKINLDQGGILKPWALMMGYSLVVSFECEQRKQYENELVTMAKSNSLPIGELETFEFQIAIFDSIPYQRQLEMLMKTVREKDKNKASFNKLIKAYKQQDINKLLALSMEDSDMKELSDKLFTLRNKNWIPVIIDEAKKQSTFFAFGAGHLGGQNGVIDLLKKEGYKVKPVKP